MPKKSAAKIQHPRFAAELNAAFDDARQQGFDQSMIAREIGITTAAITNVKNSSPRKISAEKMLALIRALRVSPEREKRLIELYLFDVKWSGMVFAPFVQILLDGVRELPPAKRDEILSRAFAAISDSGEAK